MDIGNLNLSSGDHNMSQCASLEKLPSVMSFSYLSELNLQTLKNKSMARRYYTPAPNHIMGSVDLMNFVPEFHNGNSQHLCDFSENFPGTDSTTNMRKFETYSQFSTMNILSYLVGGFVGSKSQVGVTSMQGDKFQIWDLVLQKLLLIMDVKQKVGTSDNFVDVHETPLKQSYAEVTRTNFKNIVVHQNKHIKGLAKENSMANKQKKRQSNSTTYPPHKGKSNISRYNRNFSLQEIDCFSSSRWSSSRRKHFKKGMDKINKRNEREAAREGLEFIKEEFNIISCSPRDTPSLSKSTANGNNTPVRKSNVSVINVCNAKKGSLGIDHGCGLDNLDKTDFDYIQSSNKKLQSLSSFESEDSLIVFDRAACNSNVDALTEICRNSFDLLQPDDESDVSLISSDDFCFHERPISTCQEFGTQPEKRKSNCHISNQYGIIKHVIEQSCSCLCTKENQSSEYIFSSDLCSSNNLTTDISEETNSKLLKCRSLSECSLDSEDSFITFDSVEEDDPDTCPAVDKSLLRYEVGSSWYTNYDSDEDYDKINCALLTPMFYEYMDSRLMLVRKNNTWNESYKDCSLHTSEKLERNSNKKRVHFAPDDKLVNVKRMVAWDFALRSARVGCWEQCARDTMRFQDRIHRVRTKLELVLNKKHRDRIWQERFA